MNSVLMFLKRFYYIFFPIGNIFEKVKVYKNCFCYKHSNVHRTVFEGKNFIGRGSCINHCYIGKGSYISNSSSLNQVKVGRFCSIANDVYIALSAHPSSIFSTTAPAFYLNTSNILHYSYFVGKDGLFESIKYTDPQKRFVVEIGNDVWIGAGVKIMCGIKIGDGAIIGAGSIVTKDVAPYTIVGGIPAKFIRNRFESYQIDFLEKFQWWNKGDDWLHANCVNLSDITKLMLLYS